MFQVPGEQLYTCKVPILVSLVSAHMKRLSQGETEHSLSFTEESESRRRTESLHHVLEKEAITASEE